MFQVGDKLGRFRLDREIGQGSHGVVFMATDTALETPVAVKILHPWLTQDTAVRDRFKRELLLARRVAHPGVCRLFDLHEEGEAFFITMDYVEGQTLLNILKNEGRIQPLRAVKILRGVCQALAAAHNAGVIHRDLKPANIIVRAGDSPMILDFGTATAGDVSRVTRPGTAVGSMRFIAPEIFTGVSPSIRTDIYSLGVVAYVTLAGKLPYNAAAGALEMLEMIRNQPPQRLDVAQPDVPARLADVIGKAMEKNPEQRFANALALDEALADVERMMESNTAKASQTGDFARWAPSQVIRDAVEKPAAMGNVGTPTTGTAIPTSAAGPEEPVTKEVNPADLGILMPPRTSASAPQSENAPATVVDMRPPELTNASLPLVSAMLQEPVTDAGMRASAIQTDPGSDGGSIPEATQEQPDPLASGETLVTSRPDVTVRVARVDLDDAERAAVGKGPDKRVLIAAAALLLIAVVAAAIKLGGTDSGAGGDVVAAPDAGQPTDTVVDAGSTAVAAAPDAGTADAPDAGEIIAAAPDAGPPVVVNDTLEFEDPVETPDTPKDPNKPPRPRPPENKVDAEIMKVRVAMKAKGLIPGDINEVEQILLKAKKANDDKLVAQAKAVVDKQNVDRAFVLSKMQRFNSKYDKSKRPDIADKVEPLAREAASAWGAGQFQQANDKLNRAFLLVAGKAK